MLKTFWVIKTFWIFWLFTLFKTFKIFTQFRWKSAYSILFQCPCKAQNCPYFQRKPLKDIRIKDHTKNRSERRFYVTENSHDLHNSVTIPSCDHHNSNNWHCQLLPIKRPFNCEDYVMKKSFVYEFCFTVPSHRQALYPL